MKETEREMLRTASLMKIKPADGEEIAMLTEAISVAKQMGERLILSERTDSNLMKPSEFCPLREDIVQPSLPVEEVLRNAPEVFENQIVIPLTVGNVQQEKEDSVPVSEGAEGNNRT